MSRCGRITGYLHTAENPQPMKQGRINVCGDHYCIEYPRHRLHGSSNEIPASVINIVVLSIAHSLVFVKMEEELAVGAEFFK